MSGWPSKAYAIIPARHIFSRQNNLLEASRQWKWGCICMCVCVMKGQGKYGMSVHTHTLQPMYIKVREKKNPRQSGDLAAGCTSTTQDRAKSLTVRKHIEGENSTFNCLYSSSTTSFTLYCIHLSVYLFIYSSDHPSIFLPHFHRRCSPLLCD